MTMIANSSGVVSGTFTVPAGVPVGTKLVAFTGSGGSHGEGQYIAEHIRRTVTRRQRIGTRRFDPLAETFTASRDFICGGLDLWIATKGASPIEVQIRETQVGYPTATMLASARLAASAIQAGALNRFTFDPVRLQAGTEYALVVLCNDAVSAVAVAQLGKWDAAASKWVTAQPYSVGTLLSSSNASTWTAHQDMDLTFRLLEATFTATSATFDLGTVTVSGAKDFMVAAEIESLGTGCGVAFELTMPSGAVHRVSAGQHLALASAETGSVGVKAILTGTAASSPVMPPATVQVFHGATRATGTYISRIIPAGGTSKVTVTFEALTPGSSGVTVDCQASSDSAWAAVPFSAGTAVGDGWQELTYQLTGYAKADVRVRLTLAGAATARPAVRKLRVIVT